MGHRTQYFKYLYVRGCLPLPLRHVGICMELSNCDNKIEIPKNATACRIKNIPDENMIVEKLRFTKINTSNFSQVLNEFKKVDFRDLHVACYH